MTTNTVKATDAAAQEPVVPDVRALARWALRASYDELSPQSLQQIPVHLLDAVGCQLAALGAGPVDACRAQVQEFSPSGAAPLVAGGTSNPMMAAFWHTVLVRYVDVMDNFLAPTETCHTADNFGGVLTAAALAGSSGKELMLGMAVGWTAQSRYVDHADFMTRGFDHTAQLAFSVPAAAGRLLGMSEDEIANAVAMAAASDSSFAAIRSKPLSQWKGLASAQSTLSAYNCIYLARRGVQGPVDIVEMPNGIDHALGMHIDIDWDSEGYEGVATSTIKRYVAEIHCQPAIQCMTELRGEVNVAPEQIVSIEADVPQITFNFAGGGLYGNATAQIRYKEQADHSLPYLLAVAYLDGTVMPPQFTPDRINSADVQELLGKVVVRPDAKMTSVYPREFPSRIIIRLKDGTVHTHEIQGYTGMPNFPFTWDDSVDKFDQLTDGVLDASLAGEIKDVCRDIASHETSDLVGLLQKVPYPG